MLKIFTIKFEDKLETFNDSMLSNFLGDKEIISWESHFFERKNEHYWTVIAEYRLSSTDKGSEGSDEKGNKKENYNDILTENDIPLFNRLREWRKDKSKDEGVPPYIIFTNRQLAEIAVTKPSSLNALQEIKGIGDGKRKKYGEDLLEMIEAHVYPVKEEDG